MRISIIGPGDISYHFFELLNLKKEDFMNIIDNIGKNLAESSSEIVILPDNGISFEIAKKYKKYSGKKLIAAIPKDDKTFGINHLKGYLKDLKFDEEINTSNWYKHDLIKGLLGNKILFLGNSPGTLGELYYAIYLFKLISGRKEGIEIAGKYIDENIMADNNFSIIVYSPFLINKRLPMETEEYIKKFNIKLIYINNPKELKSCLIR